MQQTQPKKYTIEAGARQKFSLNELLNYKELIFFLAWRDILLRYKQTIFGVAWTLINTSILMLIFSLICGKFAKLPSGNIPYPLLVYTGIVPWQLFSTIVMESAFSPLKNSALITKVYFPRVILCISASLISCADFAVSGSMLIVLLFLYKQTLHLQSLLLPFLIIYVYLAALGLGFWCSALNIRYRDFRYFIPFCIQVGIIVSPIGFSTDIVPKAYHFLYALNPAVIIIDGFRWAILGQQSQLNGLEIFTSVLLSIIVGVSGLLYFLKTEDRFADTI